MIDLFQIEKKEVKKEYRDSEMAIIGVSMHLPLTDSLDDLYMILNNKIECVGGLSENRKKDVVNYLMSKGNENISFNKAGYLNSIDKFSPELFKITPYEAKLINPNQRLALMSMYEAIEDSGYGSGRLCGSKTGVFVGYVELDGYKYREMIVEKCSKDDIDIGAVGNLNSMIPARISYLLDLKGPCISIDTACSSSLTALYQACRSIENGDCEQAIISACRISILPYDDGMSIGMESKNGSVRAFDDFADGTVKGEGCISILIKPANMAIKDKDNIYAIIKGGAVNQDGATMGITAPNAEAQKAVILEAWKNSGVNPEEIGCVEAHGTGTKIGDVIEIEGLNKAFSEYTNKKQFCAIGSIKSNYGHMYDAAGLAGIMKCIVQLKHKKLLPSTNFDVPNKRIGFENTALYVCNNETDWSIDESLDNSKRICAVSSFGFSGTNCHMVLEEAPKLIEEIDEKYHILALSAYNEASLIDLVKKYYKFFSINHSPPLSTVCYTANMYRSQEKNRIVLVFKNLNEVKEMLFDIMTEKAISSKLYCKYSLDDKLSEQINIFLSGEKTDWAVLYNDRTYHRVSVPYASLPVKRYWINIDKEERNYRTITENIDNKPYYDVIVDRLLKLVRDLLEMPTITAADNLLNIGVDSIMMLKLQKQIDVAYPGIVTLSKMFAYPTISRMAQYICEQLENSTEAELELEDEHDVIQEFLLKDDDLNIGDTINKSVIKQNDDMDDLSVEQLLEKINNL